MMFIHLSSIVSYIVKKGIAMPRATLTGELALKATTKMRSKKFRFSAVWLIKLASRSDDANLIAFHSAVDSCFDRHI